MEKIIKKHNNFQTKTQSNCFPNLKFVAFDLKWQNSKKCKDVNWFPNLLISMRQTQNKKISQKLLIVHYTVTLETVCQGSFYLLSPW